MTIEVVDSGKKRRDTAASIRDLYSIDTRLTSALSGCVFKSVEKSSRVSVALWISRWPLDAVQSEHFIRTAQELTQSGLQQEVISFGLDSARYGWVAFRPPSGRHILDGKLEQTEIERRYLGCVRSVAQFHRAGLQCGDVSLDAFLLQAGGEPRFVGGLGSLVSAEAFAHAAQAPELKELAIYIAPEQREGYKETKQGDVYSLAMLAYRFFLGNPVTDSFPEFTGDGDSVLPPIPGAPGWVQKVIVPILSGDLDSRPLDADDLIQRVVKSRQSELEDRRDSVDDEKKTARLVRTTSSAGTSSAIPRRANTSRRTQKLLWPVLLCIGIAVLGVIVGAGRPTVAGISWLSFGASSKADRERKLNELGLSDDPMAHEALLRMLKDSPEPEARSAVIAAVLVRSRRLGLLRASDLVREWYAAGEPRRLLEGDHPIALKIVNPALSDTTRQTLALQAYPNDKGEVVQLLAAVGLDRGKSDLYTELFIKADRDLARVEDTAEHSTKALMLAVPVIRALYFGDIFDAPPELSRSDTAWLLHVLGVQGDPLVRRLATLAIQNKTYEGARSVFAEALRDGVSLSTRERSLLVGCLAGKMSADSVSSVVSSYFSEASRVLFAIAYLSPDEAVRRAAFDGVVTKPLTDPFVRKLADFVRNKRSQQRDTYVRLIATIALNTNLDQNEFNQGFTTPEQASAAALRDKDFVIILLRSAPARVVSEVLRLIGAQLDVGMYLELLSNPNKEVRLEGLQRLDGVNDATAITFIRQSYESEQDPEVRSEYQARFFSNRAP